MRHLLQALLAAAFITFSFGAMVSIMFMYQLLNFNFWTNTFIKHDLYSKVSETVNLTLEAHIKKEGGNINDVGVLTSLVTVENTRDFLDRNIKNVLDFLNGKSGELLVYIPVHKLPESVLPQNFKNFRNEITLSELGNYLRFSNIENIDLKNLSKVGQNVQFLFVFCISLLVLTAALTVIATQPGSRFIILGICFIVVGLMFVSVNFLINRITGLLSADYSGIADLSKALLVVILPPLADEIGSLWNYAGGIFILTGVPFLVIKKPSKPSGNLSSLNRGG